MPGQEVRFFEKSGSAGRGFFLDAMSFLYEDGDDSIRQLRQFLWAIAYLNAGAEFRPLLFGGFVHSSRVVP